MISEGQNVGRQAAVPLGVQRRDVLVQGTRPWPCT